MNHYDPALSYDEMLHVFKASLGQALSGNRLPHDSSVFTMTVILALLDVANAVRQGRPTQSAVTRASEAFAVFAADFAADDETTEPWDDAHRSQAVRSLRIAN